VRSFIKTTEAYEAWRGSRAPIVTADLELKHERLRTSPFVFLRGTYYRFLEQLVAGQPELARAPAVVAVGDLHIENFGTWRDHDARLVWGVNDFDEADLLPYTIDLARLATSALLAIEEGHMAIDAADACEALLDGWRERVEGRAAVPFVLGEQHAHLYKLASEAFARPGTFARHLYRLAGYDQSLPKGATRLLADAVPWPGWKPELRARTAGVGSLGARRAVALGPLAGGLVVREAKQVPGPASLWLWPRRRPLRRPYDPIAETRAMAADPWRRQRGKWVVRPLAPDATRLELTELRRRHDERAILRSMGAEAANVHLVSHPGAASAGRLRRDVNRRPAGWLIAAARAMASATRKDHAAWARGTR
jgi:hypothetical protein